MAQITAQLAARQPSVRRTLFWTLGLGAFGLAFSITTTAAYLPPLLQRFTDSGTLIGLVLGAEGVFALALSPVIGPWSDTFHTPLGRRRPFMLAALGPLGFCLLLMPFMPNLWTTTLIVLAFFFAYYVYEPPYRGLYPDLLPPSTYGRAQGIQHVLRGIALGLALVGGGFLRRPVRHRRAASVEGDLVGAARRGGDRLRDRGRVRGAARGPLRARARRVLRLVHLRRRFHRRGHRDHLAQLVLRADRSRLGRRRHRDDARVGAAVQADAGAAPRCDLGAGDDDEGARVAARRAGRGGRDRP